MKSPVIKRSIVIAGHKTSVSLEDAFWGALKEIAIGRERTLSDLVGEIDSGRPHGNLSSAIRLFFSTITGQKQWPCRREQRRPDAADGHTCCGEFSSAAIKDQVKPLVALRGGHEFVVM